MDLAKRPKLDAAYQANLATYNNLTGMFLPGQILPVSGPPTINNFFDPVMGSAASLLLSWQPYTFGQDTRQKKIYAATAEIKKAEADNELFQYQLYALNAYLDWQMAGEMMVFYQKNLIRTLELSEQVNALTSRGLQPAVDSAMVLSEISRLKIEVLNVQKIQENYRIILTYVCGTDPTLEETTFFFDKLPTALFPETNKPIHPLLQLANNQIIAGEAQVDLIKNQIKPKIQLWGTTYARGSGIDPQGETEFIKGLGLQRFNYGFGAQISYPLLRGAEIKTETKRQSLLVLAQKEQLNHQRQHMSEQQQLARHALESALKTTQEIPHQKHANEYVLQALTGRYKNGLVNFSEVLHAQYNLIKTESDLNKAHWEAWKALLLLAATSGNLDIFLNQLAN